MQLEFTKGGRGKTAPYKTTHTRVPEALKPFIELITEEYKQSIASGNEQEFLDSLKLVNSNTITALAMEVIKLKKSKKSIKTTLDNLLTAILDK